MGDKFQPKCVLDDDLCEVLLWIIANKPPGVVLPHRFPARLALRVAVQVNRHRLQSIGEIEARGKELREG